MKNRIPSLFMLFVILIIAGCDNNSGRNLDFNALFPDQAQNLADLNSPYDDFNSILPETHFGKALIFSSNRSTNGGDFHLVWEKLHATWFMETSHLVVDNSYYWENTTFVTKLLQKVSRTGNQFGPYSIGFDSIINNKPVRINLLAYSTNDGSYTYHEEFVYQESEDEGETGNVLGPLFIRGISDFEKQYISFYGPTVSTNDSWNMNPNNFTQMYFNKSENGKSAIFRINIPDSLNFMQFLSDSAEYPHEIVSELNSEANNNCPFINGNFMVFTSDRPGGLGGFDLYYTYFDGTTWSEPINFGSKINSEYDEFRPVPVKVEQFNNDLMIFSSNRPGGKGGFDLYYVGIDKFGELNINNK